MTCERLMFSVLYWHWKRRIGLRLYERSRAIDPVQEINSYLLPNDHLEACFRFAAKCKSELVTSYRSLVWPFTPVPLNVGLGLRFLTMQTRGVACISTTWNLLSKGV
jgi:hypothetical protein